VAHENAVVVQTLTEFLGELGHSVLSVRSAADLAARLEGGFDPPELVLIQLGVPELDSVDVLRALHQRFPEMVFVLIANDRGIPAADAVACGVEGYLREPIRLRELELLVARRGLNAGREASACSLFVIAERRP
jgi:two-component system KDP operon response regulator KdpE